MACFLAAYVVHATHQLSERDVARDREMVDERQGEREVGAAAVVERAALGSAPAAASSPSVHIARYAIWAILSRRGYGWNSTTFLSAAVR